MTRFYLLINVVSIITIHLLVTFALRLPFLMLLFSVALNFFLFFFFNPEKAYDCAWRYSMLYDLCKYGLHGNLSLFIPGFFQSHVLVSKASFKCILVLFCLPTLHRRRVCLVVLFFLLFIFSISQSYLPPASSNCSCNWLCWQSRFFIHLWRSTYLSSSFSTSP